MDPTLHKILTDWAFRVPDGSPDPANPYHMVLLERSMDGMGLPRRFKQGLLKRLREIDFVNKGEFDKYNSQHKMRKSTKVTIGDKETTVGDVEKPTDGPSTEQLQKEKEKKEFLLNMANALLQGSTEEAGVGRFNMSKEDLDKYKLYLEGNKPEIPNYDISDDEVFEKEIIVDL